LNKNVLYWQPRWLSEVLFLSSQTKNTCHQKKLGITRSTPLLEIIARDHWDIFCLPLQFERDPTMYHPSALLGLEDVQGGYIGGEFSSSASGLCRDLSNWFIRISFRLITIFPCLSVLEYVQWRLSIS
jgi:hypothetical protein